MWGNQHKKDYVIKDVWLTNCFILIIAYIRMTTTMMTKKKKRREMKFNENYRAEQIKLDLLKISLSSRFCKLIQFYLYSRFFLSFVLLSTVGCICIGLFECDVNGMVITSKIFLSTSKLYRLLCIEHLATFRGVEAAMIEAFGSFELTFSYDRIRGLSRT